MMRVKKYHIPATIRVDIACKARLYNLKGQCHEIFDFRISTLISFPHFPNYTSRAISNFFKNSLR
jgi:hypothetical protein